MKKLLLLGGFLISAVWSKAQSDLLPAKNGDIKMTPIFHATTALEWNGKTIYLDPYNGAEGFQGLPDADIIVITHAHPDHLNKRTLEELNLQNTTLFAPQSVVEKLGNLKFKEVVPIANGEKKEVHGIYIEAVPMYNLPEDDTSRHKKGWGNGYILTLGGELLYFSGDTEDIKEMRALKNIDYAFVCMNLPYTMTVEAAASAVLDFKPKHIYPFHFRGSDGYEDVNKFKTIVNNANPAIDVRIRDWYKK